MKLFWKNLLKPFWRGQVPEPFNYPYTRVIPGAMYGRGTGIKETVKFIIGFIPWVRCFFYRRLVSERVVEDPFVLRHLDLKNGARILDFGCCTSILPLQLASLGYQVVGVDYYPYPYQHPNFTFYQMDFLDNQFSDQSFEAIYAVSSLEHVGLDYYPQEKKGTTAQKIADEFYRLLKSGGKLIVTLPFGQKEKIVGYKVYSRKKLAVWFRKFRLLKESYFVRESETVWRPLASREARRKRALDCVVCWVLVKPKK